MCIRGYIYENGICIYVCICGHVHVSIFIKNSFKILCMHVCMYINACASVCVYMYI